MAFSHFGIASSHRKCRSRTARTRLGSGPPHESAAPSRGSSDSLRLESNVDGLARLPLGFKRHRVAASQAPPQSSHQRLLGTTSEGSVVGPCRLSDERALEAARARDRWKNERRPATWRWVGDPTPTLKTCSRASSSGRLSALAGRKPMRAHDRALAAVEPDRYRKSFARAGMPAR